MVDFGYDTADYYQIHYEYGTMEDMENLLKKAKEIGLKIILDFVPNHTSDQHEWFKKSVLKEGDYTDFYVWHDGIKKDDNSQPDPPNNWVSVFRYPAWKWNEQRKQYYLHQFAAQQPDLNYRNPKVVEAMKNVLRFWLSKGVSGFRVDAVPFMFEVAPFSNGSYPDEPVNPDCPDKDDYCHTFHIYTNDQPETYDMIYQWRQILDEFRTENGGDDRVMLTEAYTNLTNIIKFYGNETRNGSHVPFNFDLLTETITDQTAANFHTHIHKFLDLVPKHQYANWVLGNHDNNRVASRYGKNRADLLNILLQTLPGIAVTYNGEEIAMTDVFIPWNETVDPQACNTNPDVFQSFSRDPARTPFQWDASTNAGFSTARKTWLPVSADYKTNNVLMQQHAPISHLHIFKKLLKLRDEPSFDQGTFESQLVNSDVIVYKRELTGSDIYVVVLNFGTTSHQIDLKSIYSGIGSKLEVITTSLQSGYKDGDLIQGTNVTAYPEVGTVFVSIK
ncbi:maltase A1 [Hermetia illucens]|nr:maltase A1 [Hermetia illucens]